MSIRPNPHCVDSNGAVPEPYPASCGIVGSQRSRFLSYLVNLRCTYTEKTIPPESLTVISVWAARIVRSDLSFNDRNPLSKPRLYCGLEMSSRDVQDSPRRVWEMVVVALEEVRNWK